MQIGTMIVLGGNTTHEQSEKGQFRSLPVVRTVCKDPIVKGEEDFNLYMNMPYLVDEAIVWETQKLLLRLCTEDDKRISLNRFNYLVHEMYVERIDEINFFDTPSSLVNSLDRLGVTVEWPQEKEYEITLVRAERHSLSKDVKYWCQSKMENNFYFYASEKDAERMYWYILHQAHSYYMENNEYTFHFKTSVPEYQEWIDKLNRMVNEYCRHPK